MISDLLSLKASLNCSRLTVELAGQVVTVTAEYRERDGQVRRVKREMALEEVVGAAGGDELEAVLVRMG